MCTAILYKTENSYFGRNLDLEYTYDEKVTITPRNFGFNFRKAGCLTNEYAIIGMAHVRDNYPLYYDAVNEKGVGIAGLNFPYNACYHKEDKNRINIAPFEFIPFVLSQCESVEQVKILLKEISLENIGFSHEMPPSPLHWMIADTKSSLVAESLQGGLKVYDNMHGVLTNNPPFDKQQENYKKYECLSPFEKAGFTSDEYFTRGSGAVGLPGDWSSMSRFAKAVFVKENSPKSLGEKESVRQFFHILSSVEMPDGSVRLKSGNEITQYSACCNLNLGRYYYTTYSNRRIRCLDMHRENLDGRELVSYPLIGGEDIFYQN